MYIFALCSVYYDICFPLFDSFWAQPRRDKHVPKAVPESCIPYYAIMVYYCVVVFLGALVYGKITSLYQLLDMSSSILSWRTPLVCALIICWPSSVYYIVRLVFMVTVCR